MEIVIKGDSKEIAALVLAVQGRRMGALQIDVPTDEVASKNGSSVVIDP